ncbi:MAG TPA: ABC-type transport auxiliary lipoprotein family protein [Planctomycetota bacterium]|nr:ABC-type transport auxiliary lipoprotein family protein [Planctomycetota bacterium]
MRRSAFLLLALAACVSAPRPPEVEVRYYTLGDWPEPAQDGSGANVVVRPLRARGRLHRPILVEASATRADYHELDRWIEPPSDLVTQLLVDALRATGRFRSVRASTSYRDAGDLIVSGEVTSLEEIRHAGEPRRARAALRIDVFGADERSVWSREFEAERPASAGDRVASDALAGAAHDAVAEAAHAIAETSVPRAQPEAN